MKVKCLGSINLLLGDFFPDVNKFLCHVSHIGEVSGTVVKSSNIYLLILGGMGISSKTRINHVPEKELGSKMNVCKV
jgi:hypothetical protein